MIPVNFPYDSSIIDDIGRAMDGVLDHAKWQRDTGKVEEVVGLVLGGGAVTRLTNQARSSFRFEIGPTQFDEVVSGLSSRRAVLAFYHSHPTGNIAPSAEDMGSIRAQFAAGVHLPWLIVSDEPARARLHWVDPQYGTIGSYDLVDESIRAWYERHRAVGV